MVDTLYITTINSLTNFTAFKGPKKLFENLDTFEDQKLDWHLQAVMPVAPQIENFIKNEFLFKIFT